MTINRICLIGGLFFLVLLMSTSRTLASTAMDDLKTPIEDVVNLLKDPKYKNPDMRQQQRDKIIIITREVFDFTEMSKRALARNWKSFDPKEQQQFVDAFADLLSNTYIDKIQGEYKDESVVFLEQEMVADNKAIVKTKVQRQSGEIPIVYSMFLNGDKWRIYDVNIEGVSLIKNYRSQFDQLLVKDSPAQLIDRLKKKTGLKTDLKPES